MNLTNGPYPAVARDILLDKYMKHNDDLSDALGRIGKEITDLNLPIEDPENCQLYADCIPKAFLKGITKVPADSNGSYMKWYDDISPYRNGVLSEDGTALIEYHTLYPYLTLDDGIDYQDYVFAGWFLDENYKNVSETAFTGGAYARFVPIDLGLPATFVKAVDGSFDNKTNDGVCFGMLDTKLKGLTFRIRYGKFNNTPQEGNLSAKVYRSITELGAYSGNKALSARKFHPRAQLLYGVNINGITPINYDANVIWESVYVTNDGTKIVFPFVTACINDMRNMVIHLPIFINTDAEITKGTFDVQFPTNLFEYVTYIDCLTTETVVVNTENVDKGILHIEVTNPKVKCDTLLILKLQALFPTTYDVFPEWNVFKTFNEHFENSQGPFYMKLPEYVYQNAQTFEYNLETPEDAAATQEAQVVRVLSLEQMEPVDGLQVMEYGECESIEWQE